MPYDVFISYSRRDNQGQRITQLIECISQDFRAFADRELVPFFDRDAIEGMDDWRQRIYQGLRESRLFLACLSPAYLESDYCQWEFVEYLKYEIGHLHGLNGVAPIYFVQVPGWENKDFDRCCAGWVAELRRRQHFDLRPWHEKGQEALRDAAVRERMEKLNRKIAKVVKRGEQAENALGNVDAHNPHFIGRVGSLRMLRDNFVKPGNIGVLTAVNGLGGLGKTALAIEYAHAYAHEYGGGRWQVRCAGKDNLGSALAELTSSIGFEFTELEKKTPDLQFERTRLELSKLAHAHEPHRSLLILDNVDRPALLEPAQVARLNCGDWLHVLATTRLGENELHGRTKDRSFLAIDELSPDEALTLIESYQPEECFADEADREAAGEIVSLLGCFTLAVESAGVYLGQFANDVSCAAFLARLRKEGLQGLDIAATQSSDGVLHGEKRLSATLRPTLERLTAPERLAVEFAALLPPDQVPIPWLRALVAGRCPEIDRADQIGYPNPWETLLRNLLSQRLAQISEMADSKTAPLILRFHRIVQSVAIQMFGPLSTQQEIERHVALRIASHSKAPTNQEFMWEFVPLHAVVRFWLQAGNPIAAQLNDQLVSCFKSISMASIGQGKDRESEQMMRRIITTAERSFGSASPAFATGLQNVASFYTSQERPEEAEKLLRQALSIEMRANGSSHPSVARLMSDLASALHAESKLPEAERHYREALRIDEQTFGGSHPICARDLNNLAQLMQDTNRLAEAEPLLRRALEIDEQSLGPEHPSVSRDINNLAALLQTANRLTEAEPLLRRSLVISERSLGPDHPNQAVQLNNLAQLMQATNRLAEAEPLMRRALYIDERSYGSEHPSVAQDLSNLAQLLQATNRLAEAEPLMRRAVAILEKSLGPEHPNVATCLNNLASLLQSTNRLAEAEPVMRRALATWEKTLGPNHPDVASSLNNLASMLYSTNRLAEAEPLMRDALAIDERSFGPDHPNVAIRLNNLARLLQDTDRLAEAEPLFWRALNILEKSLGPEHPDVATSFYNLALLLRGKGRLAEAESLMRRAVEIRRKALAPGHSDTLVSIRSLVQILAVQGKYDQAISLVRQVLEEFERALGPDHPVVLRGWNNLSFDLRMLGLAQESEPIDRRIAEATERTLGAGHALTLHRRNNLVLDLLLLGRTAEARELLRLNWTRGTERLANLTPRIPFLTYLSGRIEDQPVDLFLGQLKTLLTGPELPATPDIAVPWDLAYFIDQLRPRLPAGAPEFLTALLAALNDRASLSALDTFPEWRNQPPIPLDIPWPEN